MYPHEDIPNCYSILVYRGTCSYRGPNSYYLIRGNTKYCFLHLAIPGVTKVPRDIGGSEKDGDFAKIAKALYMKYVDFKVMYVKFIVQHLTKTGLRLDPLGGVYTPEEFIVQAEIDGII